MIFTAPVCSTLRIRRQFASAYLCGFTASPTPHGCSAGLTRILGVLSPARPALAGTLCSKLLDPTPCVFEQKQKLPLSQRRGRETKSGIETSSLFIDWMRQHRSNASLLGNQERTPDSVLQEPKPNPSPVILLADRQPRQKYNRQGVLAHPFANALRCVQC